MNQDPLIDRELVRFLDAVRESGGPKLWGSVLVRVLAVRMATGPLVSVTGVAMLELRGAEREKVGLLRRPRQKKHVVPADSRAVVLEERISVAELQAFIVGVRAGRRTIAGAEVWFARTVTPTRNLKTNEADGSWVLERFDHGFSAVSSAQASALFKAPLLNAHRYQLSGDRSRNLLNAVRGGPEGVDDELRRSRTARDGLAHLVKSSRASFSDGWTTENSLAFDVVAPLGIALDVAGCALRKGQLVVVLAAESEVARRQGVVVLAADDARGRAIEGRIKLANLEWRDADGMARAEHEVDVVDCAEVTLLLQLGDVTVQRVRVARAPGADRKSLFMAAHVAHVAEKDDAQWRQCLLDPAGSQKKEFERAVARLLGIMGLSVNYLGDDKDKDAVDVLAAIGEEYVLAIECTTGTIKGEGKLEKLIRRTAQLRTELRKNEFTVADGFVEQPDARAMQLRGEKRPGPLCVMGVLVASAPQEHLSKGAAKEAGESGIAVLAHEDLKELLRVAALDVDHLEPVRALLRSRWEYPLFGEPRVGSLARVLYRQA